MAALLKQLQSKACQATGFVSKHGSVYYKQLLEQNKQYIQEPATVEKCNELSKQLLYTRLASIPGRAEHLKKEVDSVKSMWKNRGDLKVEDAGIARCLGWSVMDGIVSVRSLEGDLHSPATMSEIYNHLLADIISPTNV